MLFHQTEQRAPSKHRGGNTTPMVPALEMTSVDIKRAGETFQSKIEDLHPRGSKNVGPNPYTKKISIKTGIQDATDRSNTNPSYMGLIDENQQSYEGQIDTGAYETGSNSYLHGGVQVNGMIGLFNQDSAQISPNFVPTHRRNRTLNPASQSYRRPKLISQGTKSKNVKLKPFSKAYMAVAMEHDHRLRSTQKSPLHPRT